MQQQIKTTTSQSGSTSSANTYKKPKRTHVNTEFIKDAKTNFRTKLRKNKIQKQFQDNRDKLAAEEAAEEADKQQKIKSDL